MSDNVAVMNAGRFEQIGSPQELYNNPRTGFVAGFVGDSNRWPGRVTVVDRGEARVELQGGGEVIAAAGDGNVKAGANVEVFVRPEVISLGAAKDANVMTGTVDSLLFNGASSRILVRTGGGNLVEVGHAGTSAIKSGDTTEISWARKHALCFTMAG